MNVSSCYNLDQTGNAFAIMSQTAKITKTDNPQKFNPAKVKVYTVCTYIHTYVDCKDNMHTYVGAHLIYVQSYVCTYMHNTHNECVCVCVCKSTYAYMYVHTYICMYVRIYVRTYVHTYILCTQVHTQLPRIIQIVRIAIQPGFNTCTYTLHTIHIERGSVTE